jgi:carboxyl-terminal processing protease
MKIRMILALGILAVTLGVLAEDLGGIGVVIMNRKNDKEPLRTQAAFPGSPGERAGIKSSGFLISVDGTNVVSMPLTQAVSMVRGPVGTSLTLEIANSAMNRTNKFTVKRARMVFSKQKVEFIDQ